MSRKRQTPDDEPHFLMRCMQVQLADGQLLAPHAHSWHQLIYSISGVVSAWTAQGSWVAPQHWAVWAPAGVAHGLRASGSAKLQSLYIRPSASRAVPQKSAVIHASPLLRELIARAVEIGMLDQRKGHHRAITQLVVSELRSHPVRGFDLPLPESKALLALAQYLSEAPNDSASQTALATRFGLGARTLERRFKHETGLSLGIWRRQARLMHGIRIMGAGATVKEAAAAAGYDSVSAFVASFRQTFETTPSRYLAG